MWSDFDDWSVGEARDVDLDLDDSSCHCHCHCHCHFSRVGLGSH